MRLARFHHDGADRVGVVVGEELVEVGTVDPALPPDIPALLSLVEARDLAAKAARSGPRVALEEVRLLAPIPTPRTFLAVGLNYAEHISETGSPRPEFPVIFNKQVGCVTGPFDPIVYPRDSTMVDYEGELAFVIGRAGRHIPRERAHELIGGYLVCNDVSARDWQARSPTMTLGKSFDTHGPIGPWVVTPDELGDPHDLEIRTWVSGELRQDSSTRHLIFDCFDLVELLSTVMTLQPGDLVSTGTPEGVGVAGKGLLEVGDVVRIEISGIGRIENPVVAESG